MLGFCTADIVKAGKKLRWIQVGHAGVEKVLLPGAGRQHRSSLTNTSRIDGPNVADQAFALLLAPDRGACAATQR